MGYSVAWVGLRDADPQVLYDAFGVEPTGTTDDYSSHPLVGLQGPGGWTVVLANLAAGGDERLFDPAFLAKLSKLAPAVFFCSDTGAKDSGVAEWEDGACRWSLVHDPDADDGPLLKAGEVPEPLESVRVSTDPFEVPTRIAHALTGFRHDGTGFEYVVLGYAESKIDLPSTSSCHSLGGFEVETYEVGGNSRPWAEDTVPLQELLHHVAHDEQDFLIYRGKNGWFMQTAAADDAPGRLMVEWQHREDNAPRHIRLVRAPDPLGGEPPSDFSIAEVYTHFLSFTRLGTPAPGAFMLDITEEIFGA